MNPTINLCIPGNTFAREIMMDIIRFLFEAKQEGWEIILSTDYDPNVYYVRNKLLGGDVTRGPNQKPYDGKLEFDFTLWIDSDVRFNFEMVKRLVSHDKDMVCGLYRMKDLKNFTVVPKMDDEYFIRNGTYQFLTVDDLKTIHDESNGLPPDPFKIDYTGLGLCLIRKTVLDSLEYPWFRPIWKTIGNMKEFTSEDVGFCMQVRKAGFDIYCDPSVVGQHMKLIGI